ACRGPTAGSDRLEVTFVSAAPLSVLPGFSTRFAIRELPCAPARSSEEALAAPSCSVPAPVTTRPSTRCTLPSRFTVAPEVMQATAAEPGTPAGVQLAAVVQSAPIEVFVQSEAPYGLPTRSLTVAVAVRPVPSE